MNLRPYQQKTIQSLRQSLSNGNKRVIMCAPTGSGKTVMFSFMLQSALQRGKKCMVLTHRTELLTQSNGVLTALNCEVVNLDAKLKKVPQNANMYVAMTQTLSRRLKSETYRALLSSLDLLIIDESHLQSFNSILPYLNAETVVIGATATPTRTGNQVSLDEFYTDIVEEVRISELVNDGYLAKPNTYGIKLNLDAVKIKGGEYDADSLGDFLTRNKVFEGVYENYTRLTPNKKAIIFSPNIESSKKLVRELEQRGLPIKHLDGNTPALERAENLTWFKSTPNALLSNVGILTAGFDEPTIEVVILYRATKSLSLFLQMVGRGSRTTPTKSEFTILDFGNNVYTHGFWESDREWSLKKAEKSDGVAPVKNCPNCSAILPASLQICEYCGTELPKTQREIEEALNVELSKITVQDVARFIQIRNFDKLEEFAHFKGYKRSWVHFRIKYEDIEAYAQHKGFNPAWVDRIKTLRGYK